MADVPAPPPLGPSQAGSVPGQGPPRIHLYTAGTPNGYKVSATVEELRAAYPDEAKGRLSYDVSSVSIWKNEQKHPDFLKINPNGRIPAITDDNFGGHNVFESASIQLWLVENYDPEHKLWFADPIERSTALSWIFWAMGGLGPMQGQANHFFRYAPLKIPYGIKRYTEETGRLFSVIEDGLAADGSGWMVGGKFSIVDINLWGWVRGHAWAGVDTRPYPRLVKWLAAVEARPATQKGLLVPTPPRQITEAEAEEAYAEVAEWVKKADAEIAAAKNK